jgi:hypothetical protein
MNLCVSLDSEFKALKRDLEGLKTYAVAVRYPGFHVTKKSADPTERIPPRASAHP